ncbi:hypothetical protein BVC80_1589g2 [Macleaya cordata]|uniref:Nuclease associated modular domain-containing protein n=1 Tax=Macleaya cordata TaxID=56857 RepID=A0A200QLD5_MACCD|nr:hypothetical protein BVC80_1589g2 [Macleaya cordata]
MLKSDIATSQPSFRNHFGTSRFQALLHGTTSLKLTFGKEKRLSSAWEVSIHIPRKLNLDMGNKRGALLIKAVATLEPKCLVQSEGQMNLPLDPDSDSQVSQYPSEDSSEMDEREKLRRLRISKANKGNVPWNKGRKHSAAETLRRIRERTKIAMQDPKVKMKLVKLGHAQSEETRTKIGVGVRIGWQRRREKLMVQENCCFEWQNLIAEASRRGYAGEEELQWDSYEVLDEQLKQEWLDSIEQRKLTPRPKGSKRAPKSLEQRRKISEAISAKWADPDYRERVCYALSKYHGTPEGAVRKPRRRPSGDGMRNPVRKKASEAYNDSGSETKSRARSRLKRSRSAPYKDPLADTKLEMIRNIRAQRAAIETKKSEAMERAKLLIAEAEKAAKALEVAATKSPLALASLMETRKLIAEATRSIQAAESGQIPSLGDKNGSYSSFELNGEGNHNENETGEGNESLSSPDKKEVNGKHILSNAISDFEFGKLALQNLLNSEEPVEMSSKDHSSAQLELNRLNYQLDPKYEQVDPLEPEEAIKYQRTTQVSQSEKAESESSNTTIKKKWIRGRLVEVVEEE